MVAGDLGGQVTGVAATAPAASVRAAVGQALIGACGLVLLAAMWELAPRLGWTNPAFFPPLSSVLGKLAELGIGSEFWAYVLSTVRTWLLGLLIATGGGIIAGLVIGLTPGARTYTHSIIEFLRPIPSVALIPGVILVFGTRYQSGVVLITYAAFWQVLLQMLYGLADIDGVARDTARSFRFTRFGFVRHVAWPTLLPFLFTGLRLAAAMALVLAVTAEMVIGSHGIGRGIMVAQTSNAAAEAYAAAVRDLALAYLSEARVVVLKGHSNLVYQERVDYLARWAARNALHGRGACEPPTLRPLRYANWLRVGLAQYDSEGALSRWHGPFVQPVVQRRRIPDGGMPSAAAGDAAVPMA